MNSRRNGSVRSPATAAAIHPAPHIPEIPARHPDASLQGIPLSQELSEARKGNGHREYGLLRDSLHILERDGVWHVVSEDYSYKTEPYYTILRYELMGKKVRPSTSAVLDAYVVPMCLERAKLAGIPVADWGIAQGFVPLPSVIYGINYFATSADFTVVRDDAKAKEVIAHVTNKGKYPFCYQKITPGATVHSCVSIFGRTADSCAAVASLAAMVYEIFSIPLVTMVLIREGDDIRLSSLSPTRFSRISGDERALLSAYLAHQEFL